LTFSLNITITVLTVRQSKVCVIVDNYIHLKHSMQIPSFHYSDFWVGIYIIFNNENCHVYCVMYAHCDWQSTEAFLYVIAKSMEIYYCP